MPAASILFIYLFFVLSCTDEFWFVSLDFHSKKKNKGSPANTITNRADFTDGSKGLG